MNKEFYGKILEVQSKLKAPKDTPNDFGGYKYRSAEKILENVKPILKELGLGLILSDEVVCVDGWHYVKSTATLFSEDEKLEVIGFAREEETLKGMTKGQITGSCSSYARKYALCGLFDIDNSNEDLDSEVFQSVIKNAEEKEKKAREKIGKAEVDALTKACEEKNIPLKEVLDYAKSDTAERLMRFEWEELMRLVGKAKSREK